METAQLELTADSIAGLIEELEDTLTTLAAGDGERFSYRPEYAKATKSVSAAILLNRILLWWHKQGKQPFYKFRKKCTHQWYNDGDSWLEEMGFSAHEFDSAIKIIGTKITQKTQKTKDQIFAEHFIEVDGKRQFNAAAMVVYWTDKNRVTWYDVNQKLVAMVLRYYRKKIAQKANSENRNYSNFKKRNYSNSENRNYIKDHSTEGDSHLAEADGTNAHAHEGDDRREGNPPIVAGENPSSSSDGNLQTKTELPEAIKAYERNIGIVPYVVLHGNADTIGMIEAVKEYPAGWVKDAIELTVIRGSKKWSYAVGILSKWKDKGKDYGEGKQDKPAGEALPRTPKPDCPTCKGKGWHVKRIDENNTKRVDCSCVAVSND
jgi:hypothetical protein